jgi:hypothetical protein
MKKLLLIAILSSIFDFTGLSGMEYEYEKVIEECSKSKYSNACFKDNSFKSFENTYQYLGKILSPKEVYLDFRCSELRSKECKTEEEEKELIELITKLQRKYKKLKNKENKQTVLL